MIICWLNSSPKSQRKRSALMWCSKACFSLQFLQQKAQSLSRRCWIWLFIFLIKIIDFNSIERKNMDHENQASICHSCYEGPLLASQDVLLWRSCVHASHQLCWGPIVRLSWLISTFPKEAITIPTTKDTDILPLNSKKTIPKMSIFQAGYIQKLLLITMLNVQIVPTIHEPILVTMFHTL